MSCMALKRKTDCAVQTFKRRRCEVGCLTTQICSFRAIAKSSKASAAVKSALSSESLIKEPQVTAFTGAAVSAISPGKMKQTVYDEIIRLRKRKKLTVSTSSLKCMLDSESNGWNKECDRSHRLDGHPDSHADGVRNPNKPLFTFREVQMICAGMLKDREDELREKYDAVLTTKLAEQYDTYVKFTHDQITKLYRAPASYLFVFTNVTVKKSFEATLNIDMQFYSKSVQHRKSVFDNSVYVELCGLFDNSKQERTQIYLFITKQMQKRVHSENCSYTEPQKRKQFMVYLYIYTVKRIHATKVSSPEFTEKPDRIFKTEICYCFVS
ncbi:hypothetical protein GQX74_015561 [Glossina fuscipes]|nr:hypothetical protein GQX74_015561 [Glossina fuscipes]